MAPMKRPAHGESGPTPTLSLGQIAVRWEVPRRVVRRLLQHGELPFEQVCGRLRVPLDSVRHFEKTRDERSGSLG